MRTKAIISLTFLLIIGFETQSKAVDISIGAAAWYANWKMAYSSESFTPYKPGLMYGPVYSVNFNNDWSIAGVFLYGKFGPKELDYSEERIDLDTTLNYSINRYLKVFGGVKYMYNGDSYIDYHDSVGPAVGVGITVPVFDNLFILGNFSVMYLKGEEKFSGDKLKFTESGFNTSLAMAYYFESMSTSVNLGYRYQRYDLKYSDDPDKFIYTFYGPTLSAVYSF
jgi:hypothetical protein